MHGVLLSVSQTFNLPGELPPFEPMHMLMANLLGSIVCVWAVLRIRDPQQVFGRYDAVGRFLFFGLAAVCLAPRREFIAGCFLGL